jgi:hypothetical protein
MADKTVKVRITGVGAYVKPAGGDRRRPFQHGQEVELDESVAQQLVDDGVAVLAKGTKSQEQEPFDVASASDEDLATWVAKTSIDDVMAAVGDNEDAKARVLAAEQARGNKARATLVERLS